MKTLSADQPMDALRKLLTAQEVADLLDVPIARVYELARQDQLPSVRLGNRQVRFDQNLLRQWIQKGGCAQADSDGESC